jgi:Tol biopolymer transport system component
MNGSKMHCWRFVQYIVIALAIHDPAPLAGVSPAIDAAGEHLAHLEYDKASKGFRLLVEDLRTKQQHLVDANLDATQLAWSPDGKHLAYAKSSSEASALLIVNVATGERHTWQLQSPELPIGVAWLSPRRVLIGSGRSVTMLNADTGHVLHSFNVGVSDLHPDFATISVGPTGEALFAARRGAATERAIWKVRLRPHAIPIQVTRGGDDASPTWFDGQKILFSRAVSSVTNDGLTTSGRHLWLLDLKSKKSRQVTAGPFIDLQPTVNRNHESAFFTRIDIAALSSNHKTMPNATTDFSSGAMALVNFAAVSQIVPLNTHELRP